MNDGWKQGNNGDVFMIIKAKNERLFTPGAIVVVFHIHLKVHLMDLV